MQGLSLLTQSYRYITSLLSGTSLSSESAPCDRLPVLPLDFPEVITHSSIWGNLSRAMVPSLSTGSEMCPELTSSVMTVLSCFKHGTGMLNGHITLEDWCFCLFPGSSHRPTVNMPESRIAWPNLVLLPRRTNFYLDSGIFCKEGQKAGSKPWEVIITELPL